VKAGRLPTAALSAVLAGGALAMLLVAAFGSPSEVALGERTACQRYGGVPPNWPQTAAAGMRRLPVGNRWLWVDRTEVTNAQFAAFVAATGYRTLAEQRGSASVFIGSTASTELSAGPPESWWELRAGADWRHPRGPGETAAQPNQPVVQVARADAEAYARWLGNRLPDEIEWQQLVGGGQAAGDVPTRTPPRDATGRPLANFWQGIFPLHDSVEDGYAGIAPVGCYPPGPTGLFDAVANVWEWTASGHGPEAAGPDAPAAPPGVVRGGSHLCAENYCSRFRVSARQPVAADTTAVHIGFRTVRDPAG